ncbi:MAG: nucleotidyl transferase AbiEii/AbiGii toxin family protein [bacterium]|nr:nucleotidyl transferase AbiEii/AbiGii toxin family protein [bacterium]
MLTRQQLEIINRKSLRYPLHVAEKDYFLALIMQIIAASLTGKTLIFKGGTALHHCYLDQYRFSEDLDFSSNRTPLPLEEVRKIFNNINYLSIKKDHLSNATIKLEKLQYTGPLIQPNSLKVEIDFLQNVLLPPQTMAYHNVWGVDFTVAVMDIKEICAEKIRAMSDRARYRDFYDIYLLLEKYQLDLDEIVSYVKQKEIRRPITKASIQTNWKVIATEKEQEMGQIYYSKQVEDSQIETLIQSLPLDSITAT